MINYYDQHCQRLFAQYSAVSAEAVHEKWRHLLPAKPGKMCDIGAGAGRDANWLHTLGWSVLAVEPAQRLRALAMAQTQSGIEWLDDCLPDLTYVKRRKQQFDLILISAVWMHLDGLQRQAAMATVRQLLAPEGLLVISLRFGPAQGGSFYPVSFAELQTSATMHGLNCVFEQKSSDVYGREHVAWHTGCFTPSRL